MSVWKSDEKLLIFASLMFEYKGGKTVNLFVFCFFQFAFLSFPYNNVNILQLVEK